VCRLSQGRVVEIAITDPCGRNRKLRPAVVLTDTDQIPEDEDGEFVVAAITTKFTIPLEPDWIRLPWSADGKAKSGLREPSVVKCRWLRKVTRKDIVSYRGWLPSTLMLEIMLVVRQD